MSPIPEPSPSTSRNPGEYPLQQHQENMLQEYLTILMRGKWVILLVFSLTILVTGYLTFTAKPIYESTALVLIDVKSKDGGVPILDVLGTTAANKITNELETLKSRSMADAVVGLLVERRSVERDGKRPMAIIRAEGDNDTLVALADPTTILKRLGKQVEFAPIRDSDIIKITARSTSPAEAALIANIYTAAYTDRNVNTSRLRSRAVREFLQSQLEAKHKALNTTETELQDYMRSSGMVDMDTDTKKIVDQLSQLEATRDAIQVDIKTQTKTLNSYAQELERLEPNVARAIGASNDAYIRLLQEQMAKLEVQRDVTVAQNPALVGKEMYSNKLKEIDEQIAALKKNLQARTDAFLAQLTPGGTGNSANGEPGAVVMLAGLKQKIVETKIELDGLTAREAALNTVMADYERRFNQIPQKVIELAKRQRARLSTEKLYLLVEEKFNEAAITETSELGYVNVMDPAAIPLEPVSPKKMQNMMLGTLVGLFLGVAVIMVRGFTDDRVRTPEDLKRRGYNPLSVIGRIPKGAAGVGCQEVTNEINEADAGERERKHGEPGGNQRGAGNGNGKGANGTTRDCDPHLVALCDSFSPIAEAYRHLRTNLMYMDVDHPAKSILVTSAGPGEGKSTTAANLAITFAQTEQKVLLVDADMRRSSLHEKFGLKKGPGLADLLQGRFAFVDSVHPRVVRDLDVITCGTKPPNPAEILGSRKMRDFIGEMVTRYDIVLFDSPPLLAVTDASVLARAVDVAVLVCSAGDTRIGVLDRASEFLASVGKRATGVVLNNFEPQKAYGGSYGYRRYGHYGYGYGYGKDVIREM